MTDTNDIDGASDERADDLEARIEQLESLTRRLDGYFDQFRSDLHTQFGTLVGQAEALGSIIDELGAGDPSGAGAALRSRFDHGLLHAEAVSKEARAGYQRDLAAMRSTVRLTQALVERMLDGAEAGASPSAALPGEASAADQPTAAVDPTPTRSFTHPCPSFDLLYRSFEDEQRGTVERITDLQRTDYLELLQGLPNEELPIVDLGCGRGELVSVLAENSIPAVGVDSNAGQIADDAGVELVEGDLFDWLDEQDDASARAIVSSHVVEHVPLDLQVRLVFEAHRVLAPGGVLILETPNVLSLATAASTFWVDPTHLRPVHPNFLTFLATEAGYERTEVRPLHRLDAGFRGVEAAPDLAEDLAQLILGHGDVAVLAWR